MKEKCQRCTLYFAKGRLAKPSTKQSQRATARTPATQTYSLKAISAPVVYVSLALVNKAWMDPKQKW